MKLCIEDFYSYKRIYWCHVNNERHLKCDHVIKTDYITGIGLKQVIGFLQELSHQKKVCPRSMT